MSALRPYRHAATHGPHAAAGLLTSRPVRGIAEEDLEGNANPGPALSADPGGEVRLQVFHVPPGDGEAFETSVGVADDHTPPVIRVGVASDDSSPLQVIDDLGDRLAADAGLGRQIAGTGAVLAEIAQDDMVSGIELAVPGARHRRVYLGIDRRVRVAKEDLEALLHETRI